MEMICEAAETCAIEYKRVCAIHSDEHDYRDTCDLKCPYNANNPVCVPIKEEE